MDAKQIKAWESLDGWNEFYEGFLPVGSSAVENKRLLIEMAKRGEPRPSSRKHPLGEALASYTKKSSSSYDGAFHALLKKIAPLWFVKSSTQKKNMLLEMVEQGEPRPSKGHPLAYALSYFTSKKSKCYDPVFTRQIEQRSTWLFDAVSENKKQLIEMAKRGEPKPWVKHHPLGRFLANYTKKTSESYDPVFDKIIRDIRPDWFANPADKKKEILVQMAKCGEARPKTTTSLGRCFHNYITKGRTSYDPEFEKLIRKLAPHWFTRSKKAA